ncbi:MAG: hypothetical protein CL596_00415 [Alteromonas sp.]|nr:hypothetical protein [Alteromonas sp.]MAY21911.1 hypothetical protein [Flavobacteriaceae bacterium]
MKQLSTLLILMVCGFNVLAQVGIGTTSPEAAIDITDTDKGILIPRIALTSSTDATSVTNPRGGVLVEGTMIWNTGTGGLSPAGYYYWEGSRWNLVLSNNQKQVHFGSFVASGSGTLTITGIGYTPSAIEFVAMNRVQDINSGAYASPSTNSNDIRMARGVTMGYATNYGGSIVQQAIAEGSSGSSLNNIGTYASNSHCIAAFFVNNNGEPIHDNGTATGGADTQGGLVRASLQSFDSDGFTLNFDRFLAPTAGSPDRTNQIVIIYKAYR